MANLTAPSRVNRRAAAFLPTEAAVQDSIVQGLTALGYTVLEIGRWHYRVRCPKCATFFSPKTGMPNTKGAPDLLVGHKDWGTRLLGIEVKAPGGQSLFGKVQPGHVKPEQRALADMGLTVIVHSWEQALAVVQSIAGSVYG